jgi:hypothetical protein
VLEAVLDALGDLDLALARQELDRAHFAHVHAHRVRRAAELGVERARGGFRFFLDVFGRRGGGRLRHQQGVRIGRLVEDLDAHVADHRDHALDLLGVDQLVGQVVVDLGVGEVAALLAEHDQALQAALARLDVGCGQLARRHVGLLAVAALLAAAFAELGRQLGGHLAGGLRGRLVVHLRDVAVAALGGNRGSRCCGLAGGDAAAPAVSCFALAADFAAGAALFAAGAACFAAARRASRRARRASRPAQRASRRRAALPGCTACGPPAPCTCEGAGFSRPASPRVLRRGLFSSRPASSRQAFRDRRLLRGRLRRGLPASRLLRLGGGLGLRGRFANGLLGHGHPDGDGVIAPGAGRDGGAQTS